MPHYSFECDHCEQEYVEFYKSSEVPKTSICPRCKGGTVRVFRPMQISIFNEYVTPHITGEPMLIRSRKHEKDVCTANGLMRVTSDEFNKPNKPKAVEMPPLREDYERTRHEMGVLK